MEIHQVSQKSGWHVVLCILLSLLLLPLVLGRALWDTSVFGDGVSHEIHRLISLWGFLFAQPLGWLNTIVGTNIISRKPKLSGRIIGITGIILGVLGILTGIIWSMIAVFVSA